MLQVSILRVQANISNIKFIINIIIKTYIWDPLITKWFISIQCKRKDENAKGIYLLFT